MLRPVLAPSLLAALAVVAIPIAAYGAAQPADKSDDYYTKKVCEVTTPTGSRLGGTRRCRTQAELDQNRAETKQVIERVQTMKPTFCGPGGRGC
jgi:hypothetical protein